MASAQPGTTSAQSSGEPSGSGYAGGDIGDRTSAAIEEVADGRIPADTGGDAA